MNQQVNLLAPIFRKQPTVLSARLALLACALVTAILVVVQMVTLWQVGSLAREQAQLEARRDTATRQLTQLAEQIQGGGGKSQQLVAERDRLTRDVAEKRQALAALSRSELGNTTGFSPQFIGFARQRVSGLWLTGISLTSGGRGMQLRGVTLAEELLPRYLDMLGSEPVFRGTRFGHAKLERGESASGTQLRFELSSRAPGSSPSPQAGPS